MAIYPVLQTGLLNQSSAQVIDGSLLFDGSSTYLKRTPGSVGNRRTFTISLWAKYSKNQTSDQFWAGTGINNNWRVRGNSDGDVRLQAYPDGANEKTAAFFRDTGWYHFVYAVDTTQSTANDRQKIYVNGVLQTVNGGSNPSENLEAEINNDNEHRIGAGDDGNGNSLNYYWAGRMSQVYLIDGLALTPDSFGFTDPLINTWRPKKYKFLDNPNNGITWSNNVTGPIGSGANTSLFNGVVTNGVHSTANNTLTFTPPSALSGNLKIYLARGTGASSPGTNYDIKVNGVSVFDNSILPYNTRALVDFGHFDTINNISWGCDAIGNDWIQFNAIFINDQALLDGAVDNSFYLPFDGNSPIGQDKSGNGNNWTPVSFGGSNSLEKATGALPILNTTPGGTQAAVGVFGSKENAFYTATGSSGSGSGYVFDGVSGNNPSFSFIRGATYTFDYSAAPGHPLRFSSTDPDSSTTAYTTGTNTATSNVIKFTVPHDAPDNLWYYCTNHSNMNGAISVTTDETKADKYAANCVIALPLVGSNSDVSASINSTSTTKVMTNVGNAAASSDTSNFYKGSFEFDGSGDGITCPDNTDFEFGSGDFTVECWAKQDNTSGFDVFVGKYAGSSDGEFIIGKNGNTPSFFWQDSSGNNSISATNFRANTSSWYHIAGVREGNVFTLYVNGICENSTTDSTTIKTTSNKLTIGFENDQSSSAFDGYLQDVRIYKGVAKYSGTTVGTQYFVPAATNPDILPDTPSGVSGSSKLTISPDTSTEGAVVFDGDSDYLSSTGPGTLAASSNWCMECTFYCTGTSSGTYRIMSANESAQGSEYFMMRIRNGQYQFYTSNANSSLTGTAAFNKWTHMALTKSGTTVRAFVDGVQLWSTTDNNTDSITNLITGWGYGSEYFPGFISNARFVNGSSVYTSEFNPPGVPLTNITNTTHLFCQSNTSATAAAVGTITANGTAAASRFTPFNININTVRGQESGYPTWNPLVKSTSTLSNGNLTLTTAASGYLLDIVNMFTPAGTGRWYWEFVTTARAGTDYTMVGMLPRDNNYRQGNGNVPYEVKGISVYIGSNGAVNAAAGAATAGSATAAFVLGDVLGWAFDAENGTVECYKNGISQGTQFTNVRTDVGWAFCLTDYDHTNASTHEINFGQKPFKFPPPDGFQPLNLANIRSGTEVSINPDKFVKATIGNFDTQKTHVTGFKPDFIWFKSRNNSDAHFLQDSVRGANSYLIPSSANGAGTFPQGGQYAVTSFNSNGWTQGSYGPVSNSQMVAWTWKAGGGKPSGGGFFKDDVEYASAAAAGLDSGSINPTGASVGTKQGFSIITITTPSSDGAYTVSHGLTKAPSFIIYRIYDQSMSWYVWHQGYGAANQYTLLNNTNSANSGTYVFNNTLPSASVITDYAGNSNHHNEGRAMIYYSWHDVPGLQKFGIFEGNENADGPFIELGFKPSLIITKNIDNYGTNYDWCIYDNARSTSNPNDKFLSSNLDKQENVRGDGNTDNARYVDFLSNGFKIRNNSSPMNLNAHTIIYAAWAEAPISNLFGASSNAR